LEKKDVNSLPNKTFSYFPDVEALKKMGYSVQEGNPPADKSSPDKKTVWILSGNTIQTKSIATGSTDGINTEVVSGLDKNDVVVEGVAVVKKNGNNTERSPFMPQRSGGGRSR
jgi:HlyD family secretion protein